MFVAQMVPGEKKRSNWLPEWSEFRYIYKMDRFRVGFLHICVFEIKL